MTDVAPTRRAGRLGCLPIKPPHLRLPLKWAHEYLAEAPPTPTYPVDRSGGITAWGMFGNDQYGDCVPAARYHDDMSTAVLAQVTIPVFTDSQVTQEYLMYTGGQDNGAVIADYLLWCYQRRLIKAFAPIDLTGGLDNWLDAFGGVMLGVTLTDQDQDQFAAGQPWVGTTPNPDKGHCVLLVKADSADGPRTCVTWGADQQFTSGWQTACLQEAWVVVTREEQMAAFTPQLLADINGIAGGRGGRPLPGPVPFPTPTPPPQPSPFQRALVLTMIGELQNVIAQLQSLLA